MGITLDGKPVVAADGKPLTPSEVIAGEAYYLVPGESVIVAHRREPEPEWTEEYETQRGPYGETLVSGDSAVAGRVNGGGE